MELGNNLVDTWLTIRCGPWGTTQERALKDLNLRTGRNTGRGRLYEWKSGRHTPPPDVIRAMLEDILTQVTPIEERMSRSRAAKLASALSPPNRAKKKETAN